MPENEEHTLEQESYSAGILDTDGEPSPSDESLANLSKSVEDEKNARLEERFLWFLVVIVLFDCLVFSNMSNWAAPFIIGLFELIGIVIFAERCSVDSVMPLLDRIGALTDKMSDKKNI